MLPARACAVLGSGLLAAACAGQPRASGRAEASASIDERDLRTWMSVIADDSMQGRAGGTPGHERAVRYLVDQAARIGLTPAGENGSYLQQVPDRDFVVDTSTEIRVDAERFELGIDYRPFAGGRGQPRPIDGAHAVYGGVLGDTTTHIDRGSAAGRVVVLSAPAGMTPPQAFRWMDYGGDSRLASAAAVAVAVLDLFPAGQRQPFRAIAGADPDGERADNRPTTLHITSRMAEALLGAPTSALRPGVLGRTVHGKLVFAEVARPSSNVIAMLRGVGPRRGQMVVLIAHSDAVGMGPPEAGDSIRNGADDNASGTVALLAAAKALRASGLDRSVLLVWVTAEERGLIGSRWFVDHPTVPLDSVVAVFNLDMVGRGEGYAARVNPPHLVRAIFSGAPPELLTAFFRAATRVSPPVALDTTDVDRKFCSSDQASFLRLSVPVAFLTTDTHADWHRVTDEAKRIDFDRLRRVAELTTEVVRSVANDLPGGRGTSVGARRSCRG